MTTLAVASRATLTLIVCVTACGPTMIVRDGHRVFNPAWAWALEFDREDWQKPDDVLRALQIAARNEAILDVATARMVVRAANLLGQRGPALARRILQRSIAYRPDPEIARLIDALP